MPEALEQDKQIIGYVGGMPVFAIMGGSDQDTDPGDGDEQDGEEGSEDLTPEQIAADETLTPEEKIARLSRENAKHRVRAKEAGGWADAYGGRESVERIMQATQTTSGLTRLGLDALVSVGVDRKALEALIVGESSSGRGPDTSSDDDDDDDDAPMSKKELREFLSQFVEENVKKPLLSQREADLTASTQQVIFETLDGLEGVSSPEHKKLILKFAEDHAPREGDPDEFDPQRNREAIMAGYRDFQKFMDSIGADYLKRKEQQEEGPGLLNGAGAPSIKLPKEPKNVEEAIAMANKMLGTT